MWGKTFGGAVCRWHMVRTGWSGAQSRYTAALQHYKFDVPLLAAFLFRYVCAFVVLFVWKRNVYGKRPVVRGFLSDRCRNDFVG